MIGLWLMVSGLMVIGITWVREKFIFDNFSPAPYYICGLVLHSIGLFTLVGELVYLYITG